MQHILGEVEGSVVSMAILILVIGLLLFIGLVVLHELGHFLVAQRNGVEVEEFGIGFPPRIWKKRTKAGWLFSINLLPLGGFVRLKGEHDSDRHPGSFGAAKLWPKIKIMVAGVVVNLLTAFVLLTILALLGMPKLIDHQFSVKSDAKITREEVLVGYIEPDLPAQKAGLKIRDQILAIEANGQAQKVSSSTSLPDLTKKLAGQKVGITINRAGEEKQLTTQLRSQQEVDRSKSSANPKGYLGIANSQYTVQRYTWSAPIVAGGLIAQFTELTYKGLGSALANLFRGHTAAASAQVAGPVGIFVLLKDGSLLGYQFMLMIIAIISLTLAIMNVLPIPALDGGRLFVTLLFRALKKPLKQSTEEIIHGAGFLLLMLLFVVITIVDVKRFF